MSSFSPTSGVVTFFNMKLYVQTITLSYFSASNNSVVAVSKILVTTNDNNKSLKDYSHNHALICWSDDHTHPYKIRIKSRKLGQGRLYSPTFTLFMRLKFSFCSFYYQLLLVIRITTLLDRYIKIQIPVCGAARFCESF